MGGVRPVGRADRGVDLLAWNDSAHAVEQVAGSHRRAVGKARLTAARACRKHTAQSKEAEFFLCCYPFSRARHAVVTGNERRARDFSLWLSALSGFLEGNDDRESYRRDCEDGRSRRDTASRLREVFQKTSLASRHLIVRSRRRCLLPRLFPLPETFRRPRMSSSHARPRPALFDVIRRRA